MLMDNLENYLNIIITFSLPIAIYRRTKLNKTKIIKIKIKLQFNINLTKLNFQISQESVYLRKIYYMPFK